MRSLVAFPQQLSVIALFNVTLPISMSTLCEEVLMVRHWSMHAAVHPQCHFPPFYIILTDASV